jgi:hypothetical protein
MKNRSPRLLQGRNIRALLFDAERPSNSLPLPPSARGAHTSDGQSAGGAKRFFGTDLRFVPAWQSQGLQHRGQDGSEARLGCCVFGVLLLSCTFFLSDMNYDDPLRFSTAASKRTIVQPLNALITTDLWFHLQFGYLYRRLDRPGCSPTELHRLLSSRREQDTRGETALSPRRRWAAAQRRKKLRSCNCYLFDIKHLPPTMIPSASQKVNVFPMPALAPSSGFASPLPPCKGRQCLVKPGSFNPGQSFTM